LIKTALHIADSCAAAVVQNASTDLCAVAIRSDFLARLVNRAETKKAVPRERRRPEDLTVLSGYFFTDWPIRKAAISRTTRRRRISAGIRFLAHAQ